MSDYTAAYYDALAEDITLTNKAQADALVQVKQVSDYSQQLVDLANQQDQFIPGTMKTPESLRVERLGQLEAQQRAQKAAQAANFDELLVTLGQSAAQLAQERVATATKIAKDSSVSLFEDPIGAIVNAFTLPWDQQKLAGIEEKAKQVRGAMDDVNHHVQNSAVTAEAIKTKVTEASIASESAAVANLLSAKAIGARMEALKNNAFATDRVLTLNRNQVDILHKITVQEDADEQRQMRREQHAKSMELLRLQQESAQRAKSKQDAEDAGEREMFNLVNTALTYGGQRPLENMTKMKFLPKERIQGLLDLGMRLAVSKPGTESFGETVQERFDSQFLTGWQPDPKLPAQQRIMQEQLKMRANAQETHGKDKAMMDAQTEANWRQWWNNEQNNIVEGSPLRAPAPVVFARNSDIIKHPIWQKYITPTLSETNANSPLNEKSVIAAVAEAVRTGDTNTAEAGAFLSQIFKQAVAVNNTVNEFEKIAGRRQTKYGFSTRGSKLFGRETLDLTDSVQAQAAIQGELMSKYGVGLKLLGVQPPSFRGEITNPPISTPTLP